MTALPLIIPPKEDQEVLHKTRTVCQYFNGFLYKAAHEPTLASYRIQEHIHKAAPALVSEQVELDKLNDKLTGAIFDLDYSLNVLNKMHEANKTFIGIREILKNSSGTILNSTKNSRSHPGNSSSSTLNNK